MKRLGYVLILIWLSAVSALPAALSAHSSQGIPHPIRSQEAQGNRSKIKCGLTPPSPTELERGLLAAVPV